MKDIGALIESLPHQNEYISVLPLKRLYVAQGQDMLLFNFCIFG